MLPRPLRLTPVKIAAIVLAGLAAGDVSIQEEEGAATVKSHRDRLRMRRKKERDQDKDRDR